MPRSAELPGVAGIDRGGIAILETLDLAAAGNGYAAAYLPGAGRDRRACCLGVYLFFSQFEREQFALLEFLHCTILLWWLSTACAVCHGVWPFDISAGLNMRQRVIDSCAAECNSEILTNYHAAKFYYCFSINYRCLI